MVFLAKINNSVFEIVNSVIIVVHIIYFIYLFFVLLTFFYLRKHCCNTYCSHVACFFCNEIC